MAMATQFRGRPRPSFGRGNNWTMPYHRSPIGQPSQRPSFNGASRNPTHPRNFRAGPRFTQHPTRTQPFLRQSPPFNPNVTCRYCSRVGHLERDCRTKMRDQSNTRRPRAQAHFATSNDTMEVDAAGSSQDYAPMELFMATHSPTPTHSDVWYF